MSLANLLKTDVTPSGHFCLMRILALLAISLLALLFAPLLIPEDYSWISNTISESAAQGIHGAWLARLGFVVYGLAVIWLSVALHSNWGAGARYCHLFFGIFMVSAAAFSIRPWETGAAFDAMEDFLHSFAATAMGFAYTFGVVVVFLKREKRERGNRLFDFTAAAIATVFPMLMLSLPEYQGLIQRLMFMASYLWYAKETLRLR